jgi:hypothetical protein
MDMQAQYHRDDSIEFAYHGRVFTIVALPAWSGAIWQFGCPQLGVIQGHFATRDDALLAGIAMIVRRPTQRGDLAA